MSMPAASGCRIGRATFFVLVCSFARHVILRHGSCREPTVRAVKRGKLPNGIASPTMQVGTRLHCFDHATRGHTGRTGSFEHHCIVGLLPPTSVLHFRSGFLLRFAPLMGHPLERNRILKAAGWPVGRAVLQRKDLSEICPVFHLAVRSPGDILVDRSNKPRGQATDLRSCFSFGKSRSPRTQTSYFADYQRHRPPTSRCFVASPATIPTEPESCSLSDSLTNNSKPPGTTAPGLAAPKLPRAMPVTLTAKPSLTSSVSFAGTGPSPLLPHNPLNPNRLTPKSPLRPNPD